MAVYRTHFTLRLHPDVHAKLKKIAKSESRSTTNMIEYLIKKEISQFEKENGEIPLSDEEMYTE